MSASYGRAVDFLIGGSSPVPGGEKGAALRLKEARRHRDGAHALCGAGEAMADLVAGHVPVGSMTLASAAEHIPCGRAEGIGGQLAGAPGAVPRPAHLHRGWLSRSRRDDLVRADWAGGDAGDVVAKLNQAVIEVLSSEKAKARLAQDAFTVEPLSPEEVRRPLTP